MCWRSSDWMLTRGPGTPRTWASIRYRTNDLGGSITRLRLQKRLLWNWDIPTHLSVYLSIHRSLYASCVGIRQSDLQSLGHSGLQLCYNLRRRTYTSESTLASPHLEHFDSLPKGTSVPGTGRTGARLSGKWQGLWRWERVMSCYTILCCTGYYCASIFYFAIICGCRAYNVTCSAIHENNHNLTHSLHLSMMISSLHVITSEKHY